MCVSPLKLKYCDQVYCMYYSLYLLIFFTFSSLSLLYCIHIVNILKPGVGEEQEGFASAIGEFDSLLDTAFDERGDKRFIQDNEDEDYTTLLYGGSVLDLLKSRHNCHRYVTNEKNKTNRCSLSK
jgi:hypothetical protein